MEAIAWLKIFSVYNEYLSTFVQYQRVLRLLSEVMHGFLIDQLYN